MLPFPCAFIKFTGSSIANYPRLPSLPLSILFVPSNFKSYQPPLVHFLVFVVGDSACFNQGLGRSIFFLDVLEIFLHHIFKPYPPPLVHFLVFVVGDSAFF